jgi:hypothetical protein
MSAGVKFLIGLVAVLVMGWVWHGPMGNGARLIDSIESRAEAAVAGTSLPGIAVRLGRDPLSRHATLSGAADGFQRKGMGSQPGLTGIVGAVEGVGSVGWADEPGGASGGLPLLAELCILLVLAFIAGLGISWLLWGRPKRESYLD